MLTVKLKPEINLEIKQLVVKKKKRTVACFVLLCLFLLPLFSACSPDVIKLPIIVCNEQNVITKHKLCTYVYYTVSE